MTTYKQTGDAACRLRSHDETSLLRRDVVDRFVRTFISKVFKAVADPLRLGPASVEAECGYAARILSGSVSVSGYSIDPKWHPSGLASFIRSVLPGRVRASADDAQAIEQAFALMALGAYKVLDAPEPEQEARVEALVEDGVAILLGVRR